MPQHCDNLINSLLSGEIAADLRYNGMRGMVSDVPQMV